MTNPQAFTHYFEQVEKSLKDDAASKNQKMPQSFRIAVSNERGTLFGASHLKYLVFGRGPGKMPPTDEIEDWLKRTGMQPPTRGKSGRFIKVNYQSLAFAIAKIIAKEGTMIFKGDKPGIDFVGSTEKFRPELMKNIVHGEALKIQTIIHNAK